MRSRPQTATATFPNEPESAWVAQMWAHEVVADWVPTEVAQRIELILNELMANAILYGEGDIEVALLRQHDRIEISVTDSGGGEVHAQREVGEVNGQDFAVVEALAIEWGFDTVWDRRGRRVWAQVALSPEQDHS